MFRSKVAERGIEGVQQKLRVLPLLPLGEQAGKGDFNGAVLLPDLDALGGGGGG